MPSSTLSRSDDALVPYVRTVICIQPPLMGLQGLVSAMEMCS